MDKVYENGGKLYEAMIALVLNRKHMKYVWGETLPGVGVVSDFVIYVDGVPNMTLLVTHSTSESGTHMKYWRNMEELFELKAYNPSMKVCNVTFFNTWKVELAKIAEAVFDGNYDIEGKRYAFPLLAKTDLVVSQIKGKSKKETVEILENKLKTDKDFWDLFVEFEKDFSNSVLYANINERLYPLWQKEKERVANSSRIKAQINDTWYKCGLIKLAFFDEKERKEIYECITNRKKVTSELDRKVKLFFGGTSSRIGMVDYHINYIINRLGVELTEMVISNIEKEHKEKVLSYLDVGRNMSQFFYYVDVTIPELFLMSENDAIQTIANKIREEYSNSKGNRNIFLYNCFMLCKFLDKKFSYDVVVKEGNIEHGSGPDRFAKIDKCILGEELPSNENMKKLAWVIYRRLSEKNNYSELMQEMIPNVIHQNYVTLVKHRTINYLHELVEIKLRQLGWEINEREVKFRSCLSEVADAPANTGDITFTYDLKKEGKKILMQVICAYTATHKHKELPGKLRAARYSMTSKNEIVNNKDFSYSKVILLLDGCWSKLFSSEEKLITCFEKSGWDEIICMDDFMEITDLL